MAWSNVWYVLFGAHRNDFVRNTEFQWLKLIFKRRKIVLQHSICIHIDLKADPEFYNTLKFIADCFDNVFLASLGFQSISCLDFNIFIKIIWKLTQEKRRRRLCSLHTAQGNGISKWNFQQEKWRLNLAMESKKINLGSFQLHRRFAGSRLEVFYQFMCEWFPNQDKQRNGNKFKSAVS